MQSPPTPAETFLQGKVTKQSLPLVPVPGPPGPAGLKRLGLAQGQLAHFYNGPEGIRYMACLELRAGTTRGNHYHQRKAEWVYVIRGELRVTVEDVATRERQAFTLVEGDLAFIPTQVAHCMHVISSGEAVEFSPAQFDATDTVPYRLEG